MALSIPLPGEIITFYSYKGGTGRSMALANVACLLAQRGHTVLAIDWDLEAPGLDRFFRPSANRRRTPSPAYGSGFDAQEGLIDIFVHFEGGLRRSEFQVENDQQLPPTDMVESLLERSITSTEIPKLDILKAGRFDHNYSQRVNNIDWRALFEQLPGLFPAFAECLATKYEYVLIDSRTGITDIGGICTMLMPEKLVAVFTPNQQSLIGLLAIVRAALDYRLASNDLRPLTIFPLPSRIEVSEWELLRSYRFGNADSGVSGYQPLFEELFEEIYSNQHCDLSDYFDEVQIQHSSFYAYGEAVAVLREEGNRLSLSASYKRFTDILTSVKAPWQYRR